MSEEGEQPKPTAGQPPSRPSRRRDVALLWAFNAVLLVSLLLVSPDALLTFALIVAPAEVGAYLITARGPLREQRPLFVAAVPLLVLGAIVLKLLFGGLGS